MVKPNILVFGDSIVYGSWDTQGGWVTRLRKDLDLKTIPVYKKTKSIRDLYLVCQLGRSGDSLERLLKYIEDEIKHRIIGYRETIIIIQIGINDTTIDVKSKKIRTSQKVFNQRLNKITRLTTKHSDTVILLGLTPVDESKCNPTYWNKNKSYNNGVIKKYDSIVKRVVKNNRCNYINLFDVFMNTKYKSLLIDGVHPNNKGHELICKTVKSSLTKASII